MQRKSALDSLTGCWNIRGFQELLTLGFDEARYSNTELALCQIRVTNMEALAAAAQYSNLGAVTQLLAQVLRQRLPPQGALARLGTRSFCALVPSDSPLALENQLAQLTFPCAAVDVSGSQHRLDLSLSIHVVFLSELGPYATPDSLWRHVLAVWGEGQP